MTKNLTMAIDEALLKKARKIAIDRDTTLTGLIRKYLQNLVEQEEKSKAAGIQELFDLFERSEAVVGEKTWTRDDLHER
ncbi:hypothetical protein JXO59_12525 [candidate division KSB1 bacterium]|nr:hypothetical protein [candidate division KSB1 bacterium]